MRTTVTHGISLPVVAVLVAIVAAAGLLAVSMSQTARSRALAKQAEAPRPSPEATASAGNSADVTAVAAGSYALVAQATGSSRVTVIRSSDGAIVFTGSPGRLRHLNLGLLKAGETYSLQVRRGAPVHATLVAAV